MAGCRTYEKFVASYDIPHFSKCVCVSDYCEKGFKLKVHSTYHLRNIGSLDILSYAFPDISGFFRIFSIHTTLSQFFALMFLSFPDFEGLPIFSDFDHPSHNCSMVSFHVLVLGLSRFFRFFLASDHPPFLLRHVRIFADFCPTFSAVAQPSHNCCFLANSCYLWMFFGFFRFGQAIS